MARTKNCETSRLLKMNCLILLLWISSVLAACTLHPSLPVQPRYQPIPESSDWSGQSQGYASHQIDESTFLIAYQNYFSSVSIEGKWANPFDEKWLKGAQEYVLYRAGELAKSKGAKYFAILHKDDWNQIFFSEGLFHGPHFSPGASIVMRVLDRNASSVPKGEDHIYEVDKLLESLVQKNIGLAEFQRISLPHDGTVKITDNRVTRWRSSVSGYDSESVPLVRKSFWWGGFHLFWSFEPGTEIIKNPSGAFEIAMWDRVLVSPDQLLLECVKLADREGYEVFKLENWTVEEHRANGDRGDRRIWFKTKANVVLQHNQKKSESLESVFVVEEIRSNVGTKNIQRKD